MNNDKYILFLMYSINKSLKELHRVLKVEAEKMERHNDLMRTLVDIAIPTPEDIIGGGK